MARGPFNTSCDVYCGPGSATPGALRGTVECRYVPQPGIWLADPSAPTRVAWITMKDIQPLGSFSVANPPYRPAGADQIAIPIGSEPQYWVIYTEEVFWGEQPAYWRANVAHLPLPEMADCHCDDGEGAGEPHLVFGNKGGSGPFETSGGIIWGKAGAPLPSDLGRGGIIWGSVPGVPGPVCYKAMNITWVPFDHSIDDPVQVYRGVHPGVGESWFKWRWATGPDPGIVFMAGRHDGNPSNLMMTLYRTVIPPNEPLGPCNLDPLYPETTDSEHWIGQNTFAIGDEFWFCVSSWDQGPFNLDVLCKRT